MSARCLICGCATDGGEPACHCPEPAVVVEPEETLFDLIDIDIPKPPSPYDEEDGWPR